MEYKREYLLVNTPPVGYCKPPAVHSAGETWKDKDSAAKGMRSAVPNKFIVADSTTNCSGSIVLHSEE